ncbi:LysR family transcriptional regulator [Acinetobacter pseudolwoffii]|uniref:LysR family transcriptional regulator n=1 Tax=Acinetobacter pseudolwoffii TaxID=2053287 RepID=UPI00246850BA|nr:LysR family transcriptional regulator [Acinetobacter pseudolwoffii]MDH5821163.1 LysR family transcriptional regulator [Acinetobacter pseudolwoffii]
MEIKWALDLLAIDRYKTISGAADYRNISQPALSKRLQEYERKLSVQILQKKSNKIEFTNNGIILLEYAKEINKLYEQAINEIKNSDSKKIRFAAAHSLANSFFPKWYKSNFPQDLDISLEAVNMNEGYELLLNNYCDYLICFSTEKGVFYNNLDFKILNITNFIPVTNDINNFNRSKLKIANYSNNTYIGKLLKKFLLNQDVNHHISYETDIAHNILEFILNNDEYIAWLPDFMINDYLSKTLFTLPAPNWNIKMYIIICKKKSNQDYSFWNRIK